MLDRAGKKGESSWKNSDTPRKINKKPFFPQGWVGLGGGVLADMGRMLDRVICGKCQNGSAWLGCRA